MVVHLGAVGAEQADDLERRRLAQVVDVGLVGDAEHQHLGAVQALAARVERAVELLDAEVRHVLVDLAGQLDELRPEVELARLPAQVERVDGDAVAAEAGAGLELHEAEGLGRGRVDDLPDVDLHAVAEHRQLVHQRDVDAAEDVLEQLGHLRDLGRADRHDVVERGPVDLQRPRRAGRREAADDLGRALGGVVGAPGVHALGREGEVEVDAGGQARAGLEDGRQLVAVVPG